MDDNNSRSLNLKYSLNSTPPLPPLKSYSFSGSLQVRVMLLFALHVSF